MDAISDPNEGILDKSVQRYDMLVAHQELAASFEQTLQSYYRRPDQKMTEELFSQVNLTNIALLNIINNISSDVTMDKAERALFITDLVMKDDERRGTFLSSMLRVERSTFPYGYKDKQETIACVLAELSCEHPSEGPPVQALIEYHSSCVQSDISNFMNQPVLKKRLEQNEKRAEHKAKVGKVCLQALGTAAGVVIGGYILGQRKR